MIFKNKTNLSLIIFFLLGVFLSIFLIYPLYKDIQNSSQELISQKQKLLFLEDKIKNIEGFKKNYREIKENLEKIKSLLIKSEAPISFISFLEKSYQDCQISIKISPSSFRKEKKDNWPSITFQISSICPPSNFFKFIEKIESGPFLVEINNLNIARLTEINLRSKECQECSLGDIKVSLSVKAFAN